jgi:hypothetical protein
MLPNGEVILIAAYRTTPLAALVTGTDGKVRISDRLGDTYPQVRVTAIGGAGRRVENTGTPEFQVEAWGNGITTTDALAANNIARVADDSVRLLAGSYTAGKIVAAWSIGDILHSPDPVTGRERFIVSVGLIIQPNEL